MENITNIDTEIQNEQETDNATDFLEDLLNSPDEEFVDTESDSSKVTFAGRYKSVSELEKAYQNLQAEYTRKSQELAEIKKQGQGQSATAQQTETPEEVREKIIADYLISIARGATAPTVISTPSNFAFENLQKTRTMSETQKRVEIFFKSKGEI